MTHLSSTSFIYLHGFASSPHSTKAQYYLNCFKKIGIDLKVPDLNQGDFFHLTLSRQLQQVESLLPSISTPVTLIGSSFGGLTAAWLANQHPQIKRLILLAPAFQFLSHLLPKISPDQLQQWQRDNQLSVYHYGAKKNLPISYEFVKDLSRYSDQEIHKFVPTLILHGTHDEVIPIQASQNFAATRPWVELIELDSDHSLANVMPQIWQAICRFCQLPPTSIVTEAAKRPIIET